MEVEAFIVDLSNGSELWLRNFGQALLSYAAERAISDTMDSSCTLLRAPRQLVMSQKTDSVGSIMVLGYSATRGHVIPIVELGSTLSQIHRAVSLLSPDEQQSNPNITASGMDDGKYLRLHLVGVKTFTLCFISCLFTLSCINVKA